MSSNFGVISEECVSNMNHTTVVTSGGIQELWNNIVTDLAMTAVLDGNGKKASDSNGIITVSSGKNIFIIHIIVIIIIVEFICYNLCLSQGLLLTSS